MNKMILKKRRLGTSMTFRFDNPGGDIQAPEKIGHTGLSGCD